MMKKWKYFLAAAFMGALFCPACVSALQMSHWAILRSTSGEIIGKVETGEEVEVKGICDGLLYRSYIDVPGQNLSGNVASVYIYGDTEYYYENPLEYDYTGRYEEVTDGTDPCLEAARAAAEEARKEKQALLEREKAALAEEAAALENSADADTQETQETQETTANDASQEDTAPAYASEETPDSFDYNDTYTEPVTESFEYHYTGDYDTARAQLLNSNIYWIDIDVDNQWLEFYKGGEYQFGVECTTGMKGVSDTPRGEFSILWKETTTNLEGTDLEGLYYSKYVNYWMILTEWGIGLHDSPWRNETFGGNIYEYDGTLGCITTYLPNIQYMYSVVSEGTPVLIH